MQSSRKHIETLEEYESLKKEFIEKYSDLSSDQLFLRLTSANKDLKTVGDTVELVARRTAILDLINRRDKLKDIPEFVTLEKMTRVVDDFHKALTRVVIPELQKCYRATIKLKREIEVQIKERENELSKAESRHNKRTQEDHRRREQEVR